MGTTSDFGLVQCNTLGTKPACSQHSSFSPSQPRPPCWATTASPLPHGYSTRLMRHVWGNPPQDRGTPRKEQKPTTQNTPTASTGTEGDKSSSSRGSSRAPRGTTWKSQDIKPLEMTEHEGSRPPGRKPSGPSPHHHRPRHRLWLENRDPAARPEGRRAPGGRLCTARGTHHHCSYQSAHNKIKSE